MYDSSGVVYIGWVWRGELWGWAIYQALGLLILLTLRQLNEDVHQTSQPLIVNPPPTLMMPHPIDTFLKSSATKSKRRYHRFAKDIARWCCQGDERRGVPSAVALGLVGTACDVLCIK